MKYRQVKGYPREAKNVTSRQTWKSNVVIYTLLSYSKLKLTNNRERVWESSESSYNAIIYNVLAEQYFRKIREIAIYTSYVD